MTAEAHGEGAASSRRGGTRGANLDSHGAAPGAPELSCHAPPGSRWPAPCQAPGPIITPGVRRRPPRTA